MTVKKKPVSAPTAEKKINYSELGIYLNAPVNSTMAREFTSVEDVKKRFGLPVTLGSDKKKREELVEGFAFDTLYESLTQHAINEGQYPMAAFVGYAVLQQISQNGMIRTCIQTVADDITREWIELTGGKNESDEKLEKLADVLGKRKIQSLVNNAVAKTGYFGGCFVYSRDSRLHIVGKKYHIFVLRNVRNHKTCRGGAVKHNRLPIA